MKKPTKEELLKHYDIIKCKNCGKEFRSTELTLMGDQGNVSDALCPHCDSSEWVNVGKRETTQSPSLPLT